jgi:hypothetical protein
VKRVLVEQGIGIEQGVGLCIAFHFWVFAFDFEFGFLPTFLDNVQ